MVLEGAPCHDGFAVLSSILNSVLKTITLTSSFIRTMCTECSLKTKKISNEF